MTRLLLILLFALTFGSIGHAQFNGCPAGFCAPKSGVAPYVGPGDIIAFTSWYSCTFAYNAAYAAPGNNPACDVVDSATGLITCTYHIKTNGQILPSECNGAGQSCNSACKVTKAYDQTGTGTHVTNATLATMPTLAFSALGALPSMYSGLNATGQINLTSGTITGGNAQPNSVSAVAMRAGDTSIESDIIETDGGNFSILFFPPSANAIELFSGAAGGSVTAPDTAWHAFNGVWNGASSQLNVDGTDHAVTVSNQAAGTNIILFQNNSRTATNYYIGEGGILLGTGFTSGQRTSLCHNQFIRWGTSVSC